MAFNLLSNFVPRLMSGGPSPIAISFGSSSIKLLQVGAAQGSAGAARHALQAAAEMPIPDAMRNDPAALICHCEERLPKLLREAGFRGRRAVCSVPASQTIIHHMQLSSAGADGLKPAARDELIKAQLQVQMGIHPSSVVVRAIEVAPAASGAAGRSGAAETEIICLAMQRDVVMRYVSLLEKCKLEIVGVQSEIMAMVHAFDHIHQRAEDENLTTMYIDLGWSGTCVAIAHGKQIIFARHIHVGGRHFDELIASRLKIDLAGARAHRLSLEDPLVRASVASAAHAPARDIDPEHSVHPALSAAAGHDALRADLSPQGSKLLIDDRRTGTAPPELHHGVDERDAEHAPRAAANVDLTELLDTTIDELSMCVRYHRGLFPGRSIDRAVFLGGEARQQWLCRHLARGLRLPARLGDPLARLSRQDSSGGGGIVTPGLKRDEPQPGWAVPWGLCVTSNP